MRRYGGLPCPFEVLFEFVMDNAAVLLTLPGGGTVPADRHSVSESAPVVAAVSLFACPAPLGSAAESACVPDAFRFWF